MSPCDRWQRIDTVVAHRSMHRRTFARRIYGGKNRRDRTECRRHTRDADSLVLALLSMLTQLWPRHVVDWRRARQFEHISSLICTDVCSRRCRAKVGACVLAQSCVCVYILIRGLFYRASSRTALRCVASVAQ